MSARPGVSGVTGTYGAPVPSVQGRGQAPGFFDPTDRRASGPSKPGRRSDRTEGAPLSLPSSGRLAAQGRTRPRWRGDREKRRTREEGRLVRNVSPEVLLCRSLSATPPCLWSPWRPCCSVSRLLAADRWSQGTRGRRRALGCCRQTVLVRAGSSMAPGWPAGPDGQRQRHRPLDGLPVPARGHRRPSCRRAGDAWRTAGRPHPGPSARDVAWRLIRTDRVRVPGPTVRADRPECLVDLRWSGKPAAHGGNVQVITAPAGWPIGTFLLHHRHGRTT